MTRHRQLVLLLRAYVGSYAVFFFCVLLGEREVYTLLDLHQELLGFGQRTGGAPAVAVWKYVALGYIGSLGLLSAWSQADPGRHRVLVQLMVYGKFLAAALMVGHFAVAGGVTAFLVAGLSDAAMGLGALVFLERAFPGSARQLLTLRPLEPVGADGPDLRSQDPSQAPGPASEF